jgi:hypothetical protein
MALPTRILLALALLVAFGAAAFADTFVMKDGRRIEGKLKRETADTFVVESAVGQLELKKSDVKERLKGLTPREEYAAREKLAKTAEDFFQLGEYASANKLKLPATKAYTRAIELDANHAGARKALGHVQYKGEWMTPEERDARQAADEEAEMLAQGLVRWKTRWVTPAEKEKLEQGLEQRGGKWLSADDAKRFDGFEKAGDEWFPRGEALARQGVLEVEKLLGKPLPLHVNSQAVLAGDWDPKLLAATGEHVVAAREWFDTCFRVKPGLELLGDRLAEFYLWNRESDSYRNTVEHFAKLTPTVPEGWAAVVKERHGFVWIDPYACSSARVWNRPDDDLVGHCVHHWGHMLLGRLGYDGRLLPPWYDEGFASLTEFRRFNRNAVFCRAASTIVGTAGTSAKKSAASFSFDPGLFREGAWPETLRKALEAKSVPVFDRLAQLEVGQLELLDIACGMAIVWWLEEQGGEALSKFHAHLRQTQPKAPDRVIQTSRERLAQYDGAFAAAVGLNGREADAAWRAWFLARGAK